MPEADRYKTWDGERLPAALSAAVFAGDLVLIRDGTVDRLVERARRLVEDVFGSDDPEAAESSMDPDAFRARVTAARKTVVADPDLAALWSEVLRDRGYAIDDVFRDRIRLRAVPSQSAAQTRRARPLPIHRDSWGACIHAQINWWLPLYPLSETRTMLIWPDMFDAPIANSSEDWDYDALLSGRTPGYPLLPEALRAPQSAPVPVLIEPGALLAFSAAHLHAGVTDGSGRARLSLDTRTVWADDIRAGRGAPNVDCALKTPRWELFQPGPDAALRPLADDVANAAIGGAR